MFNIAFSADYVLAHRGMMLHGKPKQVPKEIKKELKIIFRCSMKVLQQRSQIFVVMTSTRIV